MVEVSVTAGVEEYTLRTRRLGTWIVAVLMKDKGSKDETQKNDASPRHEIRGKPSSSGLDPIADNGGADGVVAADFPSEPWNWVDFEPHPSAFCLSGIID